MERAETVLITRARDGEREAFHQLVERHGRQVYLVAYRMVGNEPDAEEVVQETFLRAFRKLHRFDARSSIATWLHRIAANCAIDLLRSRGRHELLSGESPDPSNLEQPAHDPNQEQRLVQQQAVRFIEHKLQALSPAERVAFTLRHYQNLSIAEIAATMNIQPSAAKHAIFRAVRKLRVALEPLVRSSS